METLNHVPSKNQIAEAPFRIKDLMLGELMCQARILTDAQLLRFTNIARAAGSNIGSALVFSNVLTPSELFVARRLVNRFINDSDNAELYINAVRDLLRKQALVKETRGSLSLAKITRKHMTMSPAQQLTLVS